MAGGPLRFRQALRHARGGPTEVVDASAIPDAVFARLTAPRAPIAGVPMDRPSIMGIVNVTPDSFSDGGLHANGPPPDILPDADILDIGGESTRPGATEVPVEEEIARLRPGLRALANRRFSVDTRKAPVARAALDAGAAMVNDVSGLTFDPNMAAVVAQSGAALCIMHSVGTPENMQDDPRYGDVLLDVYDALQARIDAAEKVGISRNRILADPGIGFGKTEAHNLALLRGLALFHGLGTPLLLGVSRKGMIGRIGQAPDPAARMPGTLALTLHAVSQGVQMHRVHDVAEVAQGLRLWRAVTEVR